MLTRHILIASSLLAATPLAATAQGALTFGYAQQDPQSFAESLLQKAIDGTVDVDFGNGLTLGASVSARDTEFDGIAASISDSVMSVSGGYTLAGGARVGAYAEQSRLSSSPALPEMPLTLTSYGVSAGYSAGAVAVEGFVGTSDLGSKANIPIDVRDLGLVAHYTPSDRLTLGASLSRSTLEAKGSATLAMIGVAGAYDIDPSWTVFGAAGQSSIALGPQGDFQANTLALGVSYGLAAAAGLDYRLSLELARTSYDTVPANASGRLDTVRVGLTIPLGGAAAKVPLNSAAHAVMTPRYSALGAKLLCVTSSAECLVFGAY